MNTNISNVSEVGDVYKFSLSNINVSLANALRRCILSDIPTLAFYTENYEDNQCIVHVNTTRLHNEFLKHRLSCIPIHEKDLTRLPGNYVLEIDVKNDTEQMIIITTEHFKIKDKATGNFISQDEVRKIFPANSKTMSYIDFARVRPQIGDSIPGEQLKLTAEFSVHTAKDNSMFNVVSKCSYRFTNDPIKTKSVWDEYENKLRADEYGADEIQIHKKNFYALDAERYYKPDSFDFVIQTIGVFDNIEIVKKACAVLQNRLVDMIKAIDSNMIPINISETTVENSYDIILENEDYTLGPVLEYLLNEQYYVKEKIFTFCGFKKFHPHNEDSTLRIAYVQAADKRMVSQHLRIACIDASDIFKKIYGLF
jgi:DNA-directed RNA polymerase alpha subunit